MKLVDNTDDKHRLLLGEDDELRELPVIVITAWNRADLEDTGQAIACLQKPVDLAQLVRTIEEALS